MFKNQPYLVYPLSLIIIVLAFFNTNEVAAQDADEKSTPTLKNDAPPLLLKTSPKIGADSVDPATNVLSITFDQPMAAGFSWTGGGEIFPKIPEGKRPYWSDDQMTCYLPVELEPGKFYRVGINAGTRFSNFRGQNGIPTETTALYFCTAGASDETKLKLRVPKIVKLEPANNSTNVSPSLQSISVTFDIPMGSGMSWTGGGPSFPGGVEGKRASWSPDQKTCTLPVSLKPNWEYHLGINSYSFKNFSSAWGVPVESVPYSFKTSE